MPDNRARPRARCTQVDVDEAEDAAAEMGVTSMPTVLAFFEGREVQRLIGASSDRVRQFMTAFLEQVLPQNAQKYQSRVQLLFSSLSRWGDTVRGC